jgi:phosphoribosylformimino-5-aminoimidazole carboxamide ribotide isomerase
VSATREPPPPFEILPAIDIRAGRVVDLFQGDYSRETVYDDAAEAVVERFIGDGARWIHVVDLDGSRGGSPANRDLVRDLARMAGAAGVRVQLGGGIRSLEAAHAALESGVSRVIFGTAAVERPDVVAQAVRRFGPAAVAVGIDARRGLVATRGWTETAPVPAVDLARRMVDCGVVWLIYTDVERDSTLTEPNFAELERLRRSTRAAVIASGGVTTVEQVHRLAALDLAGAIIGSAIYAGRLTLRQALAAAAAARQATDPAATTGPAGAGTAASAGGRSGPLEPQAEPGRE